MELKILRLINHIVMSSNLNVQNILLSKNKRLCKYNMRPFSNYVKENLEIRWEQ
jgi:hypothetical protein